MQLLVNQLAKLGFLKEIVYDIKAFVDRSNVFQRENKPSSEHATTHSRDRPVNDIEQRTAVFLHRSNEFKRTNGKAVKSHILVFFNAGKRSNVIDLRVLSQFKILKNGTTGNDSVPQMLHTEAFQRLCAEMFQQLLTCILLGEHPLIHFKHAVFRPKKAFKILLMVAVVKHFLRRKVAKQLLNIVVCTLSGKEFAR